MCDHPDLCPTDNSESRNPYLDRSTHRVRVFFFAPGDRRILKICIARRGEGAYRLTAVGPHAHNI
jgi:hypothetical protein